MNWVCSAKRRGSSRQGNLLKGIEDCCIEVGDSLFSIRMDGKQSVYI